MDLKSDLPYNVQKTDFNIYDTIVEALKKHNAKIQRNKTKVLYYIFYRILNIGPVLIIPWYNLCKTYKILYSNLIIEEQLFFHYLFVTVIRLYANKYIMDTTIKYALWNLICVSGIHFQVTVLINRTRIFDDSKNSSVKVILMNILA